MTTRPATGLPTLTVAIGDTWQPRYLAYFGMALMGTMLVTNILNLKFISLFGFTINASIFTYVFSLVLADVMAEVYGYRRVRRLLWAGLGVLIFYALTIQLAVWSPAATVTPNNTAFDLVFAAAPRIVVASITAYLFTEMTNSFIMSRLKVRFTGRYFYGRAMVAVGLAQLVDSALFFGIAYFGTMPLGAIFSAASVAWVMIMLTELIILPLTKHLAVRVKHAEGIEHYDAPPPTALA